MFLYKICNYYIIATHKSEDYKLYAVDYYLTEDKRHEEVCKIFKCSARSFLRWVDKYNENGEIKRHNRRRKLKINCLKIGVLNMQRCKNLKNLKKP